MISNVVLIASIPLDNQRFALLTTVWPVPATFPATKFGSKNRSFVQNWLTLYPGLVYSAKTDGAFCRYCVAFSDGNRGALTNSPFRDWKDAKSKFNGMAPPLQTSNKMVAKHIINIFRAKF